MPELRQDPVTAAWVVIATERAKRPSDFPRPAEVRKGPEACPFCMGHEGLTPPEIMAYRPAGGQNQPGWQVRVVPNKYPALSSQEQNTMNPGECKFYRLAAGYGAHEVVVESPDHDANLGSYPREQLRLILAALRERYRALRHGHKLRYIQVFKNHGATAGASLEHPHFQLIGTPVIPSVVAQELEGAYHYYREHATCVYCRMIEQETHDGTRIVAANAHFLAFCPYSSRTPFEMWLLPRDHCSDFDRIDEPQLAALADLIKETCGRLLDSLANPPFNLVLHTAPLDLAAPEYYHWHLEVIPRLTIFAGFELGTGMYINPTPPEVAAHFLQPAPTEPH